MVPARQPPRRMSSGNSAFGAVVALLRTTSGSRGSTRRKCRRTSIRRLGFVSRAPIARYSQAVEYGPRPRNHRYIRQVNVGGSLDT